MLASAIVMHVHITNYQQVYISTVYYVCTYNKQLGPKNIDVCIESKGSLRLTPPWYIDSSEKQSSRSWKFKMVLFDHRFLLLENRSGCTGFLAKYGNQYTHYHATLGCSRSCRKVRLSSKEKRMPGIPRPRLASIAFNEASASQSLEFR